MTDRPYIVLSCAMSLDGHLDDTTADRLILSNAADLDRVDALRADSDAVLVGAATVRADNPRLVVRDEARRRARVDQGRAPDPVKVTVTASGKLDPHAAFFTVGSPDKATRLVYTASSATRHTRGVLGETATVVDAGALPTYAGITGDLRARGIGRLLVEGGGTVLTGFLSDGLADELHLVVAPFFVGDDLAPRFVTAGSFPWTVSSPARLLEARPIGDVVLLRYALSARVPMA